MNETKTLKVILVAVIILSAGLIGFSQYRYHTLVSAVESYQKAKTGQGAMSANQIDIDSYSRNASANGGGVIPNSIGKSLLDESGPVGGGTSGTCMVTVTDYTYSPPRMTCAHYSSQ